ncbi:MAG: hypothetical protein ABI237_06055 [Ginsengibacter sp.]
MKTLNDIDLSTIEGKLLFAALVVLTSSKDLTILGTFVNGAQTEPDEMLHHITTVAESIHFESEPENLFKKP